MRPNRILILPGRRNPATCFKRSCVTIRIVSRSPQQPLKRTLPPDFSVLHVRSL